MLSLIPLRDHNPTQRTAWVTFLLIGLNVAAFVLWQPTFASGQEGQAKQLVFFYCNAEVPWEVTHQQNLAGGGEAAVHAIDQSGLPGQAIQDILRNGDPAAGIPGCPDKSWVASIFVAMFLHGGWLHIAGNMLFLLIFGNNVEDRMGHLVFPMFYLLGGVAAGFTHVLTGPDSAIPTLGASGAIAAVLGAYLVMFPRHRVLTLVPIFFFLQLVELPAMIVLGFWFILQIFNGVGGLVAEVGGGVAYWAHIGGFVAGVLVAWAFYRNKPEPTRPEFGAPTW